MYRRPFSAAVAAAALMLAVPNAGASPTLPKNDWFDAAFEETLDRDPMSWLADGDASNLRAVRERVSLLRADIATNRYERQIRAIIESSGETAPPLDRLPLPSGTHLRIVEQAPPTFRPALAGLLAAVHKANTIVRRSPKDALQFARRVLRKFPLVEQRQIARGKVVWRKVPLPLMAASRRSDPDEVLSRLVEAVRSWGDRLEQHPARAKAFSRMTQRLDRRLEPLRIQSRRAALLVASALDEYLPSLAGGSASAAQGAPVKGCDVVDQLPLICVGSGADNRYTEDAAISIDLGGADSYSHSVAAVTLQDPPDPHRAKVNIDLGLEDDVYRSQGTGIAVADVGVAFVVDAGGNDRYVAQTRPPKTSSPGQQLNLSVNSQASATLGGVAALIDAGGNDHYSIEGRDGVGDVVALRGQATAALGSAAGLIDLGDGNDSYTQDAGRGLVLDPTEYAGGGNRRPEVQDQGTHRSVTGQGSAVTGTALLFDGGGDDTLSLKATIDYPNQEVVDLPGTYRGTSYASVIGQANVDWGGSAFVLTGAGDTDYRQSIPSTGWRIDRTLRGQANSWSVFAALSPAVVDDVGGNDEYSMTTSNYHRPSTTVGNDCNCRSAEAIFAGIGSLPITTPDIRGQGSARYAAIGLVADHGGDDSYEMTTATKWSASLIDRLTKSPPGKGPILAPVFRVFGVSYPLIHGQGFGVSPEVLALQLLPGSGLLIDDSGSDSYVAGADFNLTARIVTANRSPDVRALYGFGNTGARDPQFGMNLEYLEAQGATSSGYLLDLGGAGDVFKAYNDVDVGTAPSGGDYHQPADWPSFQGGRWPYFLPEWKNAGGGLVALGEDPTITSSPSTPVYAESLGVHGYGLWTGCCTDGEDPSHQRVDSGSGYGFAPNAVGDPVELSLEGLPESATADPRGYARLPVEARLIGSDGDPLSGKRLHFNLQWATLSPEGTRTAWSNIYQDDAATRKDGSARASLPLWIHWQVGDDLIPDGNLFFRVLATFDGDADHQPEHAAGEITLDIDETPGSRTDWLTEALLGRAQ